MAPKVLAGPLPPTLHHHRRVGLVLFRHQPHAVDPLAVFLDELAALVLEDGPGARSAGGKPGRILLAGRAAGDDVPRSPVGSVAKTGAMLDNCCPVG
jgi:hypothetical protein